MAKRRQYESPLDLARRLAGEALYRASLSSKTIYVASQYEAHAVILKKLAHVVPQHRRP